MTEETAVPEQRTASADEQALLLRLRTGEDKAFSELFELHAEAVRRLALGLAADRSEAEDITAETFFRVLQALRRGAGPRDHVRAYLLTVARRVSWEWRGARRDVPVTDDELNHRAGAGADAHAGTAERNLIATAFTSLPERWRAVLWQTEVEGEQPAVVAPHFGLSANATAALARRARQGLRAAYLQAHLAMNRVPDVGCRSVIEKLGGYTAGSVTGSEARRIRSHLLGCASCRSMHAELREVCSSLRAHAGVLAMLVPATGVASGASGALMALKGALLSKLKVGIALLSTTAAGVAGIAVGPALVGSHESRPISLPGGAESHLAAPPFPAPVRGSAAAPDGAKRDPGPALPRDPDTSEPLPPSVGASSTGNSSQSSVMVSLSPTRTTGTATRSSTGGPDKGSQSASGSGRADSGSSTTATYGAGGSSTTRTGSGAPGTHSGETSTGRPRHDCGRDKDDRHEGDRRSSGREGRHPEVAPGERHAHAVTA
ncbi:sigma-70 family RNA polymerase sigma factor [Amycolatopsis pigmentata]|uniref:Sigma-70 family RNA polymerase sigma factor n=1 Tax=Amycolatopsis pigmentata TaxID=450801 RepID=A0ABW5FTI4_9PSEU